MKVFVVSRFINLKCLYFLQNFDDSISKYSELLILFLAKQLNILSELVVLSVITYTIHVIVTKNEMIIAAQAQQGFSLGICLNLSK